jgi:hypothetical protein
MTYYTYKIQFVDAHGNPSIVSQTRACEDADYTTSLNETKLIVSQQAWAVNGFVLVSQYTESTTIITQSEYNKLVGDPSGAVPIDNWDPNVPLENEII